MFIILRDVPVHVDSHDAFIFPYHFPECNLMHCSYNINAYEWFETLPDSILELYRWQPLLGQLHLTVIAPVGGELEVLYSPTIGVFVLHHFQY